MFVVDSLEVIPSEKGLCDICYKNGCGKPRPAVHGQQVTSEVHELAF